MIKRFLLLGSICATLLSVAQNPEYAWSNAFGSESVYTEANFLAVDQHGSVYTVGAFTGMCDFDDGPSNSTLSSVGYANYIRKCDSSGAFLWVKQFGGTSSQVLHSIATDSQGNLYLSGAADGGIDLDPGAGSLVLSTDNNNFIIKLSPGGNLLWSRIDSTIFSTSYHSIYTGANDNLYVSGYYMSGYDFDKGTATYTLVNPPPGEKYGFVMKLDAAGNHVWSEAICNQPQSFLLSSLCADSRGNAYVSGSFSDPFTADPGSSAQVLSSAGDFDALLIKVDSAGAFDWVKSVGGMNNDQGSSVVCDPQGNIVLAGGFSGTVDFDPGSGTSTLTTISSGFVLKLTSSGSFGWVQTCPSWISSDNTDRRVASDQAGNIFVTSYLQGTGTFLPPSTVTVTSHGDRDVLVAKFEANGTNTWAGVIGGDFVDQPYAIASGPSGAIIVGGAFSSMNADLDPGSNTVSAGTGSAINSAFVLELNQPCAGTIHVLVPDVADFFCSGDGFLLHASGTGTVEWLWDGDVIGYGDSCMTPPLTAGDHTLLVRNLADDCSGGQGKDEVLTVVDCAGINELTNGAYIVVSPNPAQGIFQLRSVKTLSNIQVYNSAGTRITASISGNEHLTIDLSDQPKGLYLICGSVEGGSVFSRKLIKE